jgi:hypothetical protein
MRVVLGATSTIERQRLILGSGHTSERDLARTIAHPKVAIPRLTSLRYH